MEQFRFFDPSTVLIFDILLFTNVIFSNCRKDLKMFSRYNEKNVDLLVFDDSQIKTLIMTFRFGSSRKVKGDTLRRHVK